MKREIREVKDGEPKICIRCGISFWRKYDEAYNLWDRRKYCSLKCYGRLRDLSLPRVKTCVLCGEEYERPAAWSATQWRKRRFCSPECARKTYTEIRNRQWTDQKYREMMSKAHNPGQPNGRAGMPVPNLRGPRSGRWKGGITPQNRKIRTSLEYKLWRTAVFERDNYTCVWCGARSGNGRAVVLHADHIKPFAKHPELRLVVENGRTLCADCHSRTPTFSGRIRRLEA